MIIITSIPISLLTSLIYLFATGNTLNIISMSALSIAIGMVVDDAIVVLENVTTHLERGAKPKDAAVHATSEVGISVIASTLTMLAVFLPLTLINGMAGIMFRQLGWIVSIIMIVSTVGALTLIPMLCSQFLKQQRPSKGVHAAIFGTFNRFIEWISRYYSKFIRLCLGHRTITFCSFVALFALIIVLLVPKVTTEYFPSSDAGSMSMSVTLPVGTGQDVTRDLAMEIYEKIEAQVPELVACVFSLGQASTDNIIGSIQTNGTNYMSWTIDIGEVASRERSSNEIKDVLRGILADYPIIYKSEVKERSMGMGGDQTVDLEIYCYDFYQADAVAAELSEKMLASPTCSQVVISRDQYTPEYQVNFDRTKLAINGLNSTTAASFLRAAVNGSVNSYFREDGDEYEIRVRYAPEFRQSIEDIENILVYNNSGKAIRIKDLGTVVEADVPPTIERKDRERYVKLSCYVSDDYALSKVVKEAKSILAETELSPDVTVKIAGSYVDQMEMFSQLILLMALIIILVYIVMASQFESFMSPFVIMFSIPFAFIGVIIGLIVTGSALSAIGMIGILILVGIVVKNGIVLIDYTILLRERGYSIVEAVASASRSRLRPILMTTLTTVIGMIPMAIGLGEGSEMWQTLGVVVAWGLSVSTLVTLVIIPVLYCSFATAQEKRKLKS